MVLEQAFIKKFKALGAPLMAEAATRAQQCGGSVRLFSAFDDQAKSWKHPLRIIYMAEGTLGKANQFRLVLHSAAYVLLFAVYPWHNSAIIAAFSPS